MIVNPVVLYEIESTLLAPVNLYDKRPQIVELDTKPLNSKLSLLTALAVIV